MRHADLGNIPGRYLGVYFCLCGKGETSMKNVQKVLAGVVFGVAGMGAAQAEWSANIGVASAYIFRGVNFSDDAHVFGGIDWSADNSGLYAGTWVGSASGDNELDIYGGYAFDLGGGLGLDLGAIVYLFPSSNEGADHLNNSEVYAGIGGSHWSSTVWYNFGVNGEEDDEFVYLEGNVDLPLHGQFGLGLHVGYTKGLGDDFDNVDDDDYLDYGISVNAGDFSMAVTATNLDNDHDAVQGGAFPESDRPVFTVSWSKSWEGLGNAK